MSEPFHVTGDGIFSGYVTLYDVPSVTGLVFAKGSFDAFMAAIEPGDIKMLWQHDPTKPIGKWLEWRSDDIGLWMRGKLTLGTELADQVKKHLEEGSVDGLSIGFNIVEGDEKLVTVAELFEVSIVTFPAMPVQVDGETTMELELHDTLPITGVRETEDGYMTAFARVARTGIQVYLGREVGRPDLAKVRVYRPPDEVFDEEAMHSFAHRPITLDHPPEAVTAKNWKKYSIGQTGGEVDGRDGKFLSVPLVLMDGDAIQDVKGGKRELSMGYRAQLRWEDGVTPNGQKYDAVQTAIRANHLAVVTAARGGSELRIGDAVYNRGEGIMPEVQKTQLITIDGVPIEVLDVSARTIIQKLAALEEGARELREKLKAAEDKSKKDEEKMKDDAAAIADAKKATETKDAEIIALKKQLEDAKITPQKLDQMVIDRNAVIQKAQAVLGNKLVVDGKTDLDIRRQVVDARLGELAKTFSDEQVTAAFVSFTADVKPGAGTHARPFNQADRMAQAIAQNDATGNQDPRIKSYTDYNKALTNDWKNAGRPGPVTQQ